MKKIITRLMGLYLNALAYVAPRTVGRLGFNLFCTPLAPPVKDHHLKFLETATMERFDFEGIEIQTYRWGQGPKKILFVHGWQSHSFRWKSYIEHFAQKGEFTVYALDAPAHGLSGGKYINLPLYSRVIEHFIGKIHPIDTVISHSFGSFAMLHALYQASTLPLRRLVIMGTPGEANDFMDYYKKALGLSSRSYNVVLDYFVRHLNHSPEFYSAARFAKSVCVPGLIVHDEHDAETPYRYATAIHTAWKNSFLITTTGLGHNLKSSDVMKKVMEFVSEKKNVDLESRVLV